MNVVVQSLFFNSFSDGGRSIHADDKEVCSKLEAAAKILNIKVSYIRHDQTQFIVALLLWEIHYQKLSNFKVSPNRNGNAK